MNLAAQKALKVSVVSNLLAKVRRVVGYFHRSNTAAHVFKTKQKQLGLVKHKLIQDVQTRWNSAHDMLERFIEQHSAIIVALTEMTKDYNLGQKDLDNAKLVVEVLKTAKTATTLLSSQTFATVSLISPLLVKLRNGNVTDPGSAPAFLKEMVAAMSADWEKRYQSPEISLVLNKAAYLDPRFKNLSFLSPADASAAKHSIRADLTALYESDLAQVIINLNINSLKYPEC